MAKSDKANEKTNVMRLLDQAGIAYTPRYYDASLASGTEVAAALGQSAECVFKTLVAEANTGEHFVFVIPAPETLSLKKAAKAAGVKASPCCRRKSCCRSPAMSTAAAPRWG